MCYTCNGAGQIRCGTCNERGYIVK
jgi:hypothetical protein